MPSSPMDWTATRRAHAARPTRRTRREPSPETAPHTTAGKLADLDRRMDEHVHAGSAKAVERQHAKGKLTARERIDLLLDPGSFVEFDSFARHRSTNFGLADNRPYGDGVVTGYGTVGGRDICVFSQDVTVFGGSLGEVYGEKIVKILDFALHTGRPVVGINEGGGARIQEGVVSLGPVRGDLQTERAHVRRRPADLADHGRQRRRPRLLPRADRFHRDGRRHVTDVHHRARRRPVGDRRGGDARGTRRRPHPQHPLRQRALPGRRRARRDRLRPGTALLPAVEQPVDAPGVRRATPTSSSPTPISRSTR